MLYNKTEELKLRDELFQNPTKEYRGTPFWAWNCKPERTLIKKEIKYFKEMGMGGAHVHSRTGLDIPYLSEEFFSFVKYAMEQFKNEDMFCWLYDEDRWPSGSAGGIVTKDLEMRSRFLVIEPYLYRDETKDAFVATAKAVRSINRKLLGYYKISFTKEGRLNCYDRIVDPEKEEGDIWEAYLEISGDTPWFNNQAYINTFDKKAVDRFIEVTHEQYWKHFKREFSKEIPAIFTDEPQFGHKEVFDTPFEKKPIILPYTDDFDKTFTEEYEFSIIDRIPELVWELKKGEVSEARYYYHRHLCERFSHAFGDNIGKWCDDKGIKLTGHMMNEWTLYGQTMAVGEVMRPMKSFGIPGVDMLCDRRELSTLKQAASIAHQMGREGVMSEIYGVTGWTFDFRNHKLSGDWQAAMGATVRVHHLTMMSMEGEAKRDYPASIGYQSPWYKEYSYIENHFGRLNTALTRGKPKISVGIIHPIESYWLYWGNQMQTAGIRQELEKNFADIIQWMVFGLIDFDFISEAILAEEDEQKDDKFVVNQMSYEVIIIPGCHTLRKSTQNALTQFEKNGGKILFMGDIPMYMDGKPSEKIVELSNKCKKIPFSSYHLMNALQKYRDVDISVKYLDRNDAISLKQFETGIRANNLTYQMREDYTCRWIFISHVNRPVNEDTVCHEELSIEIVGRFKPYLYDTMTGEIHEMMYEIQTDKTLIKYGTSAHGSVLIRLDFDDENKCIEMKKQNDFVVDEKFEINQPEAYSCDEPNVYLLDMAEYKFDDSEWESEEEILRIDNKFRKRLGYPLRMEALAQPWVTREVVNDVHVLSLRYLIESEIDTDLCELAIEHPERLKIKLNERYIDPVLSGWYVDECIKKIKGFEIKKGMNVLEISMPFGRRSNTEWCYLLGDFGVEVKGKSKVITNKINAIFYGDLTRQGLPFYAGNIIYETSIYCEKGQLWIETSQYRGALIKVIIDDVEIGNIAFGPYEINCGEVNKGWHKIKFILFGNRHNAFGPIHNTDHMEQWYGPNLWRTKGRKWSYEYQLKKMGILTTPKYWVK